MVVITRVFIYLCMALTTLFISIRSFPLDTVESYLAGVVMGIAISRAIILQCLGW